LAPLPLKSSRPSIHRALVEGAQVDWIARRVSPPTAMNLGNLLARISRYGILVSPKPGSRCSVLVHSVMVAFTAARIAEYVAQNTKRWTGPTMTSVEWPAFVAMVKLYGALHDVGEIFGGDMPRYLPEGITAGIKGWQQGARANVLRDMGLPAPSRAIENLVKLADMAVPLAEMRVLGLDERCTSLWLPEMRERVEIIGGPLGLDPRSMFDILVVDGNRALRAFEPDGADPAEAFPHAERALPMFRDLVGARDIVLRSFLGIVMDAQPVSHNREPVAWTAWLRGLAHPDHPVVLHFTNPLVEGDPCRCFTLSPSGEMLQNDPDPFDIHPEVP
jgi:hypothetical protein